MIKKRAHEMNESTEAYRETKLVVGIDPTMTQKRLGCSLVAVYSAS